MRDTRARLMFSSEAREFLRSGDPLSVRTKPFDTVQNSVDGFAPRRSGDRALLDHHRKKERWRDSPRRLPGRLGHAVTIPGAKNCFYKPNRASLLLCRSLSNAP